MRPPVMTPLRMLIVEDNDDTASFEESTFENLGFSIRRIDRGDIAIPVMKEFQPHIVLLDLDLPGAKGHEVAQVMLADPDLKDIPIVVASVHMSDFSDPKGLDTQFFWALYQKTGNRNPRVVKKSEGKNALIELITEVCVACGEAYGGIPGEMMQFLQQKEPMNPPPFKVI